MDINEDKYIRILKNELVPAFGCTEPIAVALAGAKAREILDDEILSVDVSVSNNILKNVKSVVVPNTNGKKGIETAVSIGIVAGKSSKNLEVIKEVSDKDLEELNKFMEKIPVKILPSENTNIFDIVVYLYGNKNSVKLRIADYHTNIVYIEKNGKVIFEKKKNNISEDEIEISAVKDIMEFINNVDINKIRPMILRQIDYNTKISDKGLTKDYGANVGKNIIKMYGDNVKIRARAKAAAGSDARMGGCELPVVVVSGSGNQGITACIPVVEYAKEIGCNLDTTIRAVALSDLLTVYIKQDIGKLSAYCGAVCAGCSAGAAISYLDGGDYKGVIHALVNSLAVVSGIICDGAKPSCAGKIASAVDAGILGWQMYKNGDQFYNGDGIVSDNVDSTIKNVGQLANKGMRETDNEIVKIMLGNK